MPPKFGIYDPRDFLPMVNWKYDLVLWTLSVLVDLFFREVHPRNAYRIPRTGPIIFVAAPHANQFVDPLILMRSVRMEAHRRIAFLVAEKSMRRKFIGFISRFAGSVPVSRVMDLTKAAPGKIRLPDTEKPTEIEGIETKFTEDCEIGGHLVLPSVGKQGAVSVEIVEIIDDTHIKIKSSFGGMAAAEQLSGEGSKYKTAPKVDQSIVYEAVFHRLNTGGCVGIFPEGGSHDRPELLPLKAGVAIMALGALQRDPNSGLTIVPVGMNYFHAHKFRSRAVVEFGTPIEIPSELVQKYSAGEKREAVKEVLNMIYNGLRTVTVTSPDYETLMLVQAARRLYKSSSKKLPLPMVVELNRRLVAGYEHYKEDPRIIKLRNSVADYNRQLRLLGIRDHQVESVRFSPAKVIWTIIYRSFKLIFLALGALPGFLMFMPVFIATKVISVKKAKEALKASTVKIQAKDVIATWKLLVSLGFAPALYNFYVILFTALTYRHRFYGLVPDWVPIITIPIIGWILFPTITYAALRIGEIGMDIFKSLRPLVLALNPSTTNTIHKLRQTRIELAAEVTDLINTLGPELYPDFDAARVVPTQYFGGKPINASGIGINVIGSNGSTQPTTPISGGSSHPHTPKYHPIPKNESFTSLANIGLFASRPTSRGRSRAGSEHWQMSSIDALSTGSGVVASGSQVTDPKDLEEVAKRIKGAMEERRQRKAAKRRRDGADGDEEDRELLDGRKTRKDGWVVESETTTEDEEEEEDRKAV